jgi:hypothetical protein
MAASVGGLFIFSSAADDGSRRLLAAAGHVTDHAWSIGELLDAALAVATLDPTDTAPDRRRRFRVIDGGKQ